MLTTSSSTHPIDMARARKALSALKSSLPVIGEDFKVVPTFRIDEDHDHPLFTHPALHPLTHRFIEHAQAYGESSLEEISGYIGLVGSRQFVTYLHADGSIPLRLTMSITDTANTVNPSTRTCKPIGYLEGFERESGYKKLEIEKALPPLEEFEPQAPEGSIVTFTRRQYHAETVLPPGTVKMFLAATILY